MMGGSLGLEEPWYIQGAEFREKEREVHIFVGVRDEAVFTCPRCGSATNRHGYEKKERVWRHGDCMFYPSYIHCRRPRIHCPNCGVIQINAPFERKNSRFTLLFEGYAMLILADMPRAKGAKVLRCNEKALASILNYWVDAAVESRQLDDVTSLAIDETSFRRGHSYVTVVIDSVQRRVVDVEEGRDKRTIAAFAEKLELKGGDIEGICVVTSDMSKTYLPAIAANFPKAVSVIDKFHVKKALLDALDEVRKAEQRKTSSKQELFRGRRLFMVPKHKLTASQSDKLESLSKSYPQTGRAYRIVAALDDFYACQNIEDAKAAFASLYSWMRRCRLSPMKETANTLKHHKDKVLAYFVHRVTNAIGAGINSMIQAANRKARGFNTYRGFASMIYLIAGKLQLAVPSPF